MGQSILVTYADGPGWHHERFLLFRIAPHRWMVMTGDGDMYDEAFEYYSSWMVLNGMADGYPTAVTDVVAFSILPSDDELLKRSKSAMREARGNCRADGRPAPYMQTHMNWQLGRVARG